MREIELRGGGVALVDDQDYEVAMTVSWLRRPRFRSVYAEGRMADRTIYLHQLILGFPVHQIDHWNGDGLDNQRANLRPCTNAQNQQNRRFIKSTTGFKGVTFNRRCNRFQAQIKHNGQNHYLGVFDEAHVAAAAYDDAARRLFGAFAATNVDLLRSSNGGAA